MIDPVPQLACVFCEHPAHGNRRCLRGRKLLVGSEPCSCRSSVTGPKQVVPRLPRVNTGQRCDAHLLMPLAVPHACGTKPDKDHPKALAYYKLQVAGAYIPAWLCHPHMMVAKSLAGIEVEVVGDD